MYILYIIIIIIIIIIINSSIFDLQCLIKVRMGVTFYSGLILLVLQMNLCNLSKTPAGECNSAATFKACANESILADRAPISRVKFY